MTAFDASWIEEVNRITLQPDEMVVFRPPRQLTAEEIELSKQSFVGTPLEGRTVFIGEPGWEIDTVLPEGES